MPADHVIERAPVGELLRREAGEPAMKGATLFSGIGAPERAMPWVDWRWCAEIDPFASAVHAARFPDIVNHGDVAEIRADAVEPVDLIVFGSPCQSFSVAGRRLGLDDPRGNLALIALRLLGQLRPRWFVFENVPGLLSSDGGRDFGTLLGTMGELGYGLAYRVLDAQHFGVPQRRRRVFVVGHLGDWRPAAAVLFERESLRGDSPPRREAGEVAPTVPSRRSAGGGLGTDFDCDGGLIAFDTTQVTSAGNYSNPKPGDPCHPLASGAHAPAIAIQERAVSENLENGPQGKGWQEGVAYTLEARNKVQSVGTASAVRRLTPREAERLQGFPDDWTLVTYRGKPAADGPRYKALGNSMAVPVVEWIGSRLLAAHLLFEPRHDRRKNFLDRTQSGRAGRGCHPDPRLDARMSKSAFHDAYQPMEASCEETYRRLARK